MTPGKKIYFVSDCHFGVPDHAGSLEREKLLVQLLDEMKKDAEEIILLGDIFDFWFEYRTVVPKGYTRLLGKLAEITDAGIPITYFAGNHDMWIFDYFKKELNINIIRQPITRIINNKKFFIGHGDGLGPTDYGYKFIKKVFASKISQWLFARLHPDFGARLASHFSYKSRIINLAKQVDLKFIPEKERLVIFAKEKLKQEHFDYFIFGHRHIPVALQIADNTWFYHIGNWMVSFSYIVFDGEKPELKFFKK